MKEQSPQLTTGLSAVYLRFICGKTAALRSWLLTSVPTLICSINFVHAGHVEEFIQNEKLMVQKPGHTTTGCQQGGARPGSKAGRGEAGWYIDRTACQAKDHVCCLQKHRANMF